MEFCDFHFLFYLAFLFKLRKTQDLQEKDRLKLLTFSGDCLYTAANSQVVVSFYPMSRVISIHLLSSNTNLTEDVFMCETVQNKTNYNVDLRRSCIDTCTRSQDVYELLTGEMWIEAFLKLLSWNLSGGTNETHESP